MPMAGRLADLWGARRLLMGALVVFTVGSALAGAAQTMDQLIAARLVQAVGGGVLVPVGTAVASHLFGGAMRPRALGVVGALTFLGMAAGPVVGAAILASFHPEERRRRGRPARHALAAVIEPAWRWVFYLNIPIGIMRARPRRGPPLPTGRRRIGAGGSTSSGPRPTGSRWSPACSV